MDQLLLYFSITCFAISGLGCLFKLIICIFDTSPETKVQTLRSPVILPIDKSSINLGAGTVNIITNFISNVQQKISRNYKLNTSNIQFCREVVIWTGPILRARGVKYFPSITIRYNKASKKMGVYISSTNSIIIHLKSHKGDLTEICSTVLHEIMHHIQSKKDPEFRKLLNYKKYGYSNNRIEVEARAFENLYCQNCMKDLCEKGVISKF